MSQFIENHETLAKGIAVAASAFMMNGGNMTGSIITGGVFAAATGIAQEFTGELVTYIEKFTGHISILNYLDAALNIVAGVISYGIYLAFGFTTFFDIMTAAKQIGVFALVGMAVEAVMNAFK